MLRTFMRRRFLRVHFFKKKNEVIDSHEETKISYGYDIMLKLIGTL